jgi:predicted nucleotidyltransferase
MRTPTTLSLLAVWRKNPFQTLTLRDVMRLAGKKSKPWVFNALKELERQGYVAKTKVANANTYELKLDNPMLPLALQIVDARAMPWRHQPIINDIITSIPQKAYSLIVFGSHADGTAKPDSDVDLLVLVESEVTAKKMKPYVNDVALHSPVELDVHYVTFADFVAMLLRDDENLAKQVFRKHMIQFNPNIYFQLIKEAHKHGFRP